MHTNSPAAGRGGLAEWLFETELAVPTSWPFPPSALSHCHRLPLGPAEAEAGSGSVGPPLPVGQLVTAIIPSPQGLEGHTATTALTRRWAHTHLLDLSSLSH